MTTIEADISAVMAGDIRENDVVLVPIDCAVANSTFFSSDVGALVKIVGAASVPEGIKVHINRRQLRASHAKWRDEMNRLGLGNN